MRSLIVTLMCISFLLCSAIAYAHPPTDIIITFDPATKMVKAVIVHPVSNPQGHFIKKVDVGLNGKEIIEQQISRQDTTTEQSVCYLVPDAKPGDTISVEGYCSISGTLKKEIKIE